VLMARAAYSCWLYGEYNYPERLTPRGDVVAGLVARGSFCEAAMRLVFLLNRRYAPYWKWMHREFAELPEVAPKVDPLLKKLATSADMAEHSRIILEVCDLLRKAIRDKGLVGKSAKMEHLGAFDIMRTLEDVELARQPVRDF